MSSGETMKLDDFLYRYPFFRNSKAKEIKKEEVRSLSVSKKEMKAFHKALRVSDSAKEMMAEVFFSIVTECRLREEEMWDKVSKMFGYKNLHRLQADGMSVTIEWSEGKIRLDRIVPESDELLDKVGGFESEKKKD